MADYQQLVKEARELSIPIPRRRNGLIRTLPEPALFNTVHIITGIRRCGKTFYLFQLIHDLLEQGVPHERVLYFNFADDRLKPLDPQVMDNVLEEYYRQVPTARTKGAYLFLDEVQEVDLWQSFCQRVAEHEKATLVITGSSSKLSSEEIATSFRGRSHAHEMLPLSFREYCDFNQLNAPQPTEKAFSPQTTTAMEAAFDHYLVVGGFPKVQELTRGEHIEVLQEYVRDVVARDIAERTGREDIQLANHVALVGLRNTSREFSINNVVAQLQSYGFKAYWEKINRIYELFKQAYLFYPLESYRTSFTQDSTLPPKVYASDPGMAYAVSRANQQDIGARLETAVFLELHRRSVGRRTEALTSFTVPNAHQEKVDFLLGDALATEPYALYQVCANMESEKTRLRELRALTAAMDFTHLSQGVVITLREEETIDIPAGRIAVVPAWKWALGCIDE